MQFVYPQLLWAFGLLAIPILVHLFNFRRYKRLVFTNVHMLKEVLQETRSRRNIRHWLVLMSRILAFSALILAFSQPYIPLNKRGQNASSETAVIYVDNSFSMEAESETGPLLELAKERARQIVQAYGSLSRFYLITNVSYASRALSKEEILSKIDELNTTSRFKSASDVLKIAGSLPHNQGTALYYISDMQAVTFGDEDIQSDSSYRIYLLPVTTTISSNLSVDSFWLDRPVFRKGDIIKGTVLLSNRSSESREDLSLNMKLNGKTVSATALDIEAAGTEEITLEITLPDTGWLEGMLEISDAPLSFDDKLYFSFRIKPETRILLIGNPESRSWLRKVYSTDEHFRIDESAELGVDYGSLNTYGLISLAGAEEVSTGLAEALSSFVNDGGNLAIFPSEKEGASNEILARSLGIRPYGAIVKERKEAGILEEKHPLFEGVFEKIPQNLNAPQVLQYYKSTGAPMVGESYPLAMQGNDPLLSVIEKNGGKIYQCYVALNQEWGNFQKHALFVPVVLNMAISNHGKQDIYWHTETPALIGIESNQNFSQGDLRIKGSSTEWIPELLFNGGQTRLSTGTEISEAGVFPVVNKEAELIAKIALNYDRRESDITIKSPAEIREQWLKNAEILEGEPEMLRRTIAEMNEGRRLWKWFVLAALVFLFIEIFLLRRWKTLLQSPH